jgi:transaldolase
LRRYGEVANAFIAGVEKRLRGDESVERLRSVASFFLSRIDVLIDPKLNELAGKGGSAGESAQKLRGESAIASAKAAYQMYKSMFAGDRWQTLSAKGAHPQLLLWASTSTKNPDYKDVKYVEALVGPDTINTLPTETLEAYRDHGQPALRLEADLKQARSVFVQLPEIGINIDEVTKQLEDEGIEKFCKPYDALLETLEKEMAAA